MNLIVNAYKLNNYIHRESLHFRKTVSCFNKTVLLKNVEKSSLIFCHYIPQSSDTFAPLKFAVYISSHIRGKWWYKNV